MLPLLVPAQLWGQGLALSPCLWPKGLQGRARLRIHTASAAALGAGTSSKALFGEGGTRRFYLLKELVPVSLESKSLSSFAGAQPTACTPSLGSQLSMGVLLLLLG